MVLNVACYDVAFAVVVAYRRTVADAVAIGVCGVSILPRTTRTRIRSFHAPPNPNPGVQGNDGG